MCGLPHGQGQPNWQSPCCVCYGVDPLVSGELSWAVLVAEYFMLTQWVRKGLAPDKLARLDWQGEAVCRWRDLTSAFGRDLAYQGPRGICLLLKPNKTESHEEEGPQFYVCFSLRSLGLVLFKNKSSGCSDISFVF